MRREAGRESLQPTSDYAPFFPAKGLLKTSILSAVPIYSPALAPLGAASSHSLLTFPPTLSPPPSPSLKYPLPPNRRMTPSAPLKNPHPPLCAHFPTLPHPTPSPNNRFASKVGRWTKRNGGMRSRVKKCEVRVLARVEVGWNGRRRVRFAR